MALQNAASPCKAWATRASPGVIASRSRPLSGRSGKQYRCSWLSWRIARFSKRAPGRLVKGRLVQGRQPLAQSWQGRKRGLAIIVQIGTIRSLPQVFKRGNKILLIPAQEAGHALGHQRAADNGSVKGSLHQHPFLGRGNGRVFLDPGTRLLEYEGTLCGLHAQGEVHVAFASAA